MNQRHKDIIKELRKIGTDCRYTVSVWDARTVVFSAETIINGVHYKVEADMDDLLAIVRNVHIQPSRCVETLSNVYEILSRFETDDEYDPIVRALNVIRDAQKNEAQE